MKRLIFVIIILTLSISPAIAAETQYYKFQKIPQGTTNYPAIMDQFMDDVDRSINDSENKARTALLAVHGTNMLNNFGFELGSLINWDDQSACGGANYAIQTTNPRSGSYNLEIATNGTATCDPGIVYSQLIPVTSGASYTLLTYMKSWVSTSDSTYLQIRWFDATQTEISSKVTGFLSITTTYEPFSLSDTAPDGAAYAEVAILIDAAASITLYIDDTEFFLDIIAGKLDIDETSPLPVSGVIVSTGLIQYDDGGTEAYLDISFSDILNTDIDFYEVRLKPQGSNTYSYYQTTEMSIRILGLLSSTTYCMAIKAVDKQGNSSGYPADDCSIVTLGDTAVSPPTGLTATAGFKQIWLDWTNPIDKDFTLVEVWRSDSNDLGLGDKVAEVKTDYYSDSLGNLVTKYYWIRSKDLSGNLSTWEPVSSTAGVSATTLTIITPDIGDAAITGQKIADATIDLATKVQGLLPEANLSQITDPAKLADAIITAAKIATGAIDSSKIVDGAITTTKIGDLQVTTEKLADGSISTVKLGDAAITTQKLADGSITTTKLGDAQVSSQKLADGSVTTSKIGDAQVTTTKIGDNTITKVKFASGLQAVEIVGTLPTLPDSNYPQGSVVFLTTDNKLYRSTGTAWTTVVPTSDLSGQLTTAQIADSAVTAVKTSLAAINPSDGNLNANTVGTTQIQTDAVTELKILNDSITAAKIAVGSIGLTKFSSGLRPIQVVATLPTLPDASYPQGATVFLTTDNKLYRSDGSAWTAAVPTTDLSGQVTGTQIQDGSIIETKLGDASVTTQKVADGTITTSKIGDAQVSSTKIADGSVTTAKIGDAQVTTTKIGDGSVTKVKFASGLSSVEIVSTLPTLPDANYPSGAVVFLNTTNRIYRSDGNSWIVATADTTIGDGSITTIKLADGAVTTQKVADGTITTAKIADSQVTTSKLVDSSVTTSKIGDAQVTTTKLGDGSVTKVKFASGLSAVEIVSSLPTLPDSNYPAGTVVFLNTTNRIYRSDGNNWVVATADTTIGDGSITTIKLADAAVTTQKVADGTVTTAKIADSQVTSSKLVDGSVTTAKIGDAQVTTTKLGDGSVTKVKFASGLSAVEIVSTLPTLPDANYPAGTVVFLNTTNRIYRSDGSNWIVATADTTIGDGSITTIKLADAAVTTQKVADGTITTAKIADSQVTTNKLVDGSVTTAKIGDAQVTTTKIGDSAITKVKFASGLQPVETVSTLPTLPNASYPQGAVVFLTTDNKLYRSDGNAWNVNVPAADISGTIVGTQITDGAISTAKLAANSVTAAKIAAGTITATEIATDTITAGQIAAGAIAASEIATGAVTTAKVAAGAITSNEIAAGTIVAANIAAATITSSEIATDTITAGQIAAGAIAASEIAAGAVTTAKIAAGAVTTNEIAAGTIVAGNIATGTITANEIATNTITAGQIATGAVAADEIASGAVVAGKIAAGSIVTGDIATGTILAANIAAGTITATEIATDTITAGQIAAGAIAASEIASGAVTTAKIAAGAITANEIASGAITTAKIAAGAVTASEITADTITAGQIAAGAITYDELATNSVIAVKIASSAITSDKIAAGAVTANKITSLNFVVSAGTFTDDSPGAGSIAWSGAKVVYNGTEYTITNGNTANKYVYWQSATPTVFATSATKPAMGNTDFTVALNNSGTYLLVWNSTQVDGGTIRTGSITASELAASTITANEIAAGAITTAKITAGAITTNEIAIGTITSTNIAADTITAGEIAAGAIAASEIASGAVVTAKIASGAVTANEIAAGTITAGQIAAGTITGSLIAGGTITGSLIAADTIAAGNIAAGAIVTAKIAADAITTNEIAAGAVQASDIQAGAITSTHVSTNQIIAYSANIGDSLITSAKIADATIQAADIANATITAAKIANATITDALIANATITGAKISNATISDVHISDLSANKISAGTITGSTIRTNSGNERIELSAGTKEARWHNSSGTIIASIGDEDVYTDWAFYYLNHIPAVTPSFYNGIFSKIDATNRGAAKTTYAGYFETVNGAAGSTVGLRAVGITADLMLGSSVQYKGDQMRQSENYPFRKIAHGVIGTVQNRSTNGTCTVLKGSGFTAYRNTGAVYNVTFSSAFNSAPIVLAQGESSSGIYAINVSNVTTSGFDITFASSVDRDFSFMAIVP